MAGAHASHNTAGRTKEKVEAREQLMMRSEGERSCANLSRSLRTAPDLRSSIAQSTRNYCPGGNPTVDRAEEKSLQYVKKLSQNHKTEKKAMQEQHKFSVR